MPSMPFGINILMSPLKISNLFLHALQLFGTFGIATEIDTIDTESGRYIYILFPIASAAELTVDLADEEPADRLVVAF